MDEKNIVHGPQPIIYLTNDSFGKLLHESLLRNKHLPCALTDGITSENVSYADILFRSCSLAMHLHSCGFRQNDVAAVISENNLDYFCPVLAALYLGIVITPINPIYTQREVLHCVNISQPKLVFCTQKTLNVVLKIKQQTSFFEKIILMDSNLETIEYDILRNLYLNYTKEQVDSFVPISLNAREQVAFIQYSSGTTGLPKGVMQTHRNYSSILATFQDYRYNRQFEPGTEATLGYLPFFHGYGLTMLLLSIILGRRTVVLKEFNERIFLECIQNYKITLLGAIPTIMNFLNKSSLVDKYDLSSIQEIMCGSASLSKEGESRLKEKLKINIIRQAYGLTESTFAVVIVPYNEARFGSSGKILPYVSIKVIDLKTGEVLGPGKAGEILLKGDMVMKGYARNEEATKMSFTEDGWLITGDVGYYDVDGFFYIVDRKKELIKYKSFQVAPAELEAILLTHPYIKDAGVVGIPNEEAGELPTAFVVTQSGKNLSDAEVYNFVANEVSPPKRLRGGIRFIDQIPRSASGKILRTKLREMVLPQKSKL